MILRYAELSKHPQLFLKLSGLKLNEFWQLNRDLEPLLEAAHLAHLQKKPRQRAIGGGPKFELPARDQILMSLIWLRLYPTNEGLGYLFGVSDSTVSRLIHRVVPLLAQNGRDTMRRSDPGRKHRLELPQLLADLPELALIVDSFEQRVQRPRLRSEADTYYSGKKKQHTLKSQIAIEAKTGWICHVSASVVGPKADNKLLEESGLLLALPPKVGLLGDLGYVGLPTQLAGRGFIPKKKPRDKPRPSGDVAYNTAFSSIRIRVEHAIGRVRTYQALAQTDRHHRHLHQDRVAAVSGLINRQIESRLLAYRLVA